MPEIEFTSAEIRVYQRQHDDNAAMHFADGFNQGRMMAHLDNTPYYWILLSISVMLVGLLVCLLK